MTNETNMEEPLFLLSSTVTVNFTVQQLVELALNHLGTEGHTFHSNTLKSTYTTKGLTLIAETCIGKPPTKKRVSKKATTKAKPKKVQAPQDNEKDEPEVKSAVVEIPGNNPFKPTTAKPSNEEAIAEVKANAGIAEVTAFSTETVGIKESDSGVAPAAATPFNFDNIGT